MRVFVYEHVTAGGLGRDVPASLVREGRAMLEAVCADFRALPGVEVSEPEALATDGVQDRRSRVRLIDADATLVIAPEFDDQLLNLSQAVLDAGGRLLGSMPDAIRLTGDKLALAHFWRARGILHPRTELIRSDQPPDVQPPWVIKPRHGAGSQATHLVPNRGDWGNALQSARREWTGDLLWQAFVPGQAASIALLIGPGQAVPLLPGWQHLSSDGRLRYEGGSLPLPPPYFDRATQLALQAVAGIDGLCGYVGVDLVLGEEGGSVIEINPRLTTSYVGLRKLCRGNLAGLMLQAACGNTIDMPEWNNGKIAFGPDG